MPWLSYTQMIRPQAPPNNIISSTPNVQKQLMGCLPLSSHRGSTPLSAYFPVGEDEQLLDIADFNGDGRLDIASVNPSNQVVAKPIELGPSDEQIYPEIYATGLRNAKNVSATIGGQSVPVLFSGAAPEFPGEDQVNVGPLPRSLAGKGSVNIVVTADGIRANTVTVMIQ